MTGSIRVRDSPCGGCWDDDGAVRRILISFGLVLVLAVASLPAMAGVASAQAEGDTTSTTFPYVEGDGIIPRPNSGVAPEDAGDRGGALQTVVFVLVLAGVGVIGALVVRESRKARAGRGF